LAGEGRLLLGSLKHVVKRALRRASEAYQSARPLPPLQWGLDTQGQDGLSLGGVSLHALIRKWGSPLFVVDVSALKRNARRFCNPPAGSPPVSAFYSYKTNPVSFVLSTLHDEGIGAEVISEYEFWLAQQLGVPAERIIYNGPVKSESSVREAIQHGIGLITTNHAEELPTLARVAMSVGKRPRTGIRVAPSQGWSGQFGVPIGEAAVRAFEQALALKSLDIRAVHAHRGGMIRTESELCAFVGEMLGFTDLLAERLGIDLEILDLGGSLATPSVDHIRSLDYRLNRALMRDLPAPDVAASLTIERYLALITEMVSQHFARKSRPHPRIFIEPGRSLTGETQFLLASVHALKDAGDRTYAILDAGINIAEPTRSEYHQLLPVNRIAEASNRVYTVVGPICTPGDTLYPAVRLPELAVGDSLCIMDAGAYFVPFATSFSYPQPAIVAIENGHDFLIRHAERFDAMAARDVLPNHAQA
jgi:diaminopimelate decarboxylase